jgi:hypothetical protein
MSIVRAQTAERTLHSAVLARFAHSPFRVVFSGLTVLTPDKRRRTHLTAHV